MPTLSRDGNVFILDLGDTENHFTPESVRAMAECLDRVLQADSGCALVTVATGKYWSTGLDLARITSEPGGVADFVQSVQALLARFLLLPLPTVAALQGHAVAAGAMLALAHDARVMRADRGFFFFPEVDLKIPFTPAMSLLIQAKLPPAVANEAMTTGRRFGGSDAERLAIVDVAVAEDAVRATSLARAAAVTGKDRRTLEVIKERMYADVAAALRAPVDQEVSAAFGGR